MSGRSSFVWGLASLATAYASPAAAGNPLALVDASGLPADPAVMSAWSEAIAQEPYAATFTPEWRYPVARETVARVLSRSLATLRAAEKPDVGIELLLAIGLTARYAHNVDVKGASTAGFEALRAAASRSSNDPRPEWFLGTSLCQVGLPDAMSHLLSARDQARGGPLPAAYWRDLLHCASVSGMPAHAVLAGRELQRLDEETRTEREVVARAKGLLKDPDPGGEIPFEEAWAMTGDPEQNRFVSRVCGFAIRAGPDWSFSEVKNGGCSARGPMGPFPGKRGSLFPSIVVIARRAAKAESLDGFLASFPFFSRSTALEGYPCPSRACRVFQVLYPEAEASEGGAVGVGVAFARTEPEIRGLALERPAKPPAVPNGELQYFTELPRYARFTGTMYYLVLLDAVSSVAETAKAQYRTFLESFEVE